MTRFETELRAAGTQGAGPTHGSVHVAERVRARRRRRWAIRGAAASCVVALLAGVSAVIVARNGQDGPSVGPSAGSELELTAAGTTADGDLIAPHAVVDQRTIVPATFLDGTAVELAYPSRFQVVETGAELAAAILWDVRTSDGVQCCSRTVYARRQSPSEIYPGVTPAETYLTGDGHDAYYYESFSEQLDPSGLASGTVLLFWYEPWTIVMPGPPSDAPHAMTARERQTLVDNMAAEIADDGFVVLRPTPPLFVAPTDSAPISFGGGLVRLYSGCQLTGSLLGESPEGGTITQSGGGLAVCFEHAQGSLEVRISESLGTEFAESVTLRF